jgi:hypothetical protein
MRVLSKRERPRGQEQPSDLYFNSARLRQVIAHLESTADDEWCVDIVRSKDETKNCIFGHIFNMGGGDEIKGNDWWQWFEYTIATTSMAYPVNDGRNPMYRQPSFIGHHGPASLTWARTPIQVADSVAPNQALL